MPLATDRQLGFLEGLVLVGRQRNVYLREPCTIKIAYQEIQNSLEDMLMARTERHDHLIDIANLLQIHPGGISIPAPLLAYDSDQDGFLQVSRFHDGQHICYQMLGSSK